MKLGGFHNFFGIWSGKLTNEMFLNGSEWGNHFMDEISNFGVNSVEVVFFFPGFWLIYGLIFELI